MSVGISFRLAVLLVAGINLSFQLVSLVFHGGMTLGVGTALVIAVLVSVRFRYATFLIGAAPAILPILGSDSLKLFITIVSTLMLVCQLCKRDVVYNPRLVLGLILLCGVYASGAVYLFAQFLDIQILSDIFSINGVFGISVFITSIGNYFGRALFHLFGLVNISLLCLALSVEFTQAVAWKRFKWGVVIGASFAFAFFIGQILDLHSIFQITRNAFFIYTLRYSASFTDPNAFGISAFLLFSILVYRSVKDANVFFSVVGIIVVISAFWSGSRTLFLCLGVMLLLSLGSFGKWLTTRYSKTTVVSLCLLCVVSGVLLVSVPVDIPKAIPDPVRRVIESVRVDNIQDVVSSRVVYGRLALATFSDSPVFGVGLGRFFFVQNNVAKSLGIELGDWRDNANNFYLGCLAESGMIGLGLLFLSFLTFSFSYSQCNNDHERSYIRKVLMVFAISLVTGPHLDFSEVGCLVAACLAYGMGSVVEPGAVVARTGANRYVECVVILLLGLVLLLTGVSGLNKRSSVLAQGMYTTEGNGNWTGSKARFALCGSLSGEAGVYFETMRPNIELEPVTVKYCYGSLDNVHQYCSSVIISRNSPVKIPIEESSVESGAIIFEAKVSSLWSPCQSLSCGDSRALGIFVRSSSLCEMGDQVEIKPWANRWLSVSRT